MKVRRVDFSPDEFLVGIAGMPADEIGVYWVVCCLIYSSGGPIPEDDERLGRLSGASHQKLPHILRSLVERRHKLDLEGGLLSNKRAVNELERAEHRATNAISNGLQGGRPSNKSKDLEKPGGSENEKLTINHQLPTINQQSLGADAPKRPPRSLKRVFPSDWKPDETDIAYAKAAGYGDAWIADQAERCRDHHSSRENKFSNFHAVWRTWVKRAPEFKRSAPVMSLPQKGPRPGVSEEPHDQRMASFRKSGFWAPLAGPRPGQRGCTVPDRLLTPEEINAKYGRGSAA